MESTDGAEHVRHIHGLAVGLEPVTVSPATVLKILAGKTGVASAWDAVEENIVWGCTARVLGLWWALPCPSARGNAGTCRNSLADPFILGVSQAPPRPLGMIFGVFISGYILLPLSAFIGAGITILIVYTLPGSGQIAPQLLLSGVAVTIVMDATKRHAERPNALGLHNASF